jgi:hypothetical protein
MEKYLSPVILFLFIIGCGPSGNNYVTIPTRTTEQTEINSAVTIKTSNDKTSTESTLINKKRAVKTEGQDTVVIWTQDNHTRKFIFKGITGYKGRLDLESVNLEISNVKIFINEKSLKVSAPDYKISYELHTNTDKTFLVDCPVKVIE